MRILVRIHIFLIIILVIFSAFFLCRKKVLASEYDPYQVKGVVLSSCAMHITWPECSDVENLSKPFVISVIGKNPFRFTHKSTSGVDNWLTLIYIKGKRKIKGKDVDVRFITKLEEIPGTHMLFIAKSEKRRLNEILAVARENHAFTISDTPGFAKKGVQINLSLRKGTLEFEINQTNVVKSGFNIHFRLLKMAKILNPIKKKG